MAGAPALTARDQEGSGWLACGMICQASTSVVKSNEVMNGMLSVVVTLALPRVTDVKITDDTLAVDLEDGRTISVPIGWYPRLAYGTPVERVNFQISGAGYGIHWPDLDEDIGVEGLLLGRRSAESPASFGRWLAQRNRHQS